MRLLYIEDDEKLALNTDADLHEAGLTVDLVAAGKDGSPEYRITVPPVRPPSQSNGLAFANAILGSSHNYEPPVYLLEDGRTGMSR